MQQDTMDDQIQIELDKLQSEREVRVLLAVESGSRAWGIASPDSDYDVRFVYVGPVTSYLKLKKARDVIEWLLDDVLDIVGWDISKFLRLLRGSNPSAIEWLSSPIVYQESPQFGLVRDLAVKCYSRKASAFHYLGMLRGEEKIIRRGEYVSAKTYLYALRALLAARWSVHEDTPAPLLFSSLVEAELGKSMRGMVDELLHAKASGSEHCQVERMSALDSWLSNQGTALHDVATSLPAPEKVPWSAFDEVFLELLDL